MADVEKFFEKLEKKFISGWKKFTALFGNDEHESESIGDSPEFEEVKEVWTKTSKTT